MLERQLMPKSRICKSSHAVSQRERHMFRFFVFSTLSDVHQKLKLFLFILSRILYQIRILSMVDASGVHQFHIGDRSRNKIPKFQNSQRRRRKNSGILTDPRPHRTQGRNKPRGQTPRSDQSAELTARLQGAILASRAHFQPPGLNSSLQGSPKTYKMGRVT